MLETLNILPREDKDSARDQRNEITLNNPRGKQKENIFTAYNKTRIFEINHETLINHKIFAVEENHKVSDEFRLLRTRVFQRLNQNGWRTIMVTGFGPCDGKSTIAVNLAVTFSKDISHTTLLVDLDFRKPSIHKIFELGPGEDGLRSYFLEKKPLEEVFINPGINKLTILLAGGDIPNSPEILDSPLMKSLVGELKGRYKDRLVIFDVPSVSIYPDPLIFSENVDSILLVARRDKTTYRDVKKVISLLPNEKLLGIVFNNA